jgi:hypothetical protein
MSSPSVSLIARTSSSASLSRLVKVTETGPVVYEAEKDACRAFPEPQRDELARGTQRNFQILDPLEFLAELTQHMPPKGAHLIRYCGWYSNKARGMRRKQVEAAATASGESAAPVPARRRATQSDILAGVLPGQFRDQRKTQDPRQAIILARAACVHKQGLAGEAGGCLS